MKESIVAKRAFQFTIALIRATKLLPQSYENIVIIRQIVRSVSSIGANIQEALGTNSRRDFAHCMNVAKKEARETRYWLELLIELNPRNKTIFEGLLVECIEIINILTKIVKTANAS